MQFQCCASKQPFPNSFSNGIVEKLFQAFSKLLNTQIEIDSTNYSVEQFASNPSSSLDVFAIHCLFEGDAVWQSLAIIIASFNALISFDLKFCVEYRLVSMNLNTERYLHCLLMVPFRTFRVYFGFCHCTMSYICCPL